MPEKPARPSLMDFRLSLAIIDRVESPTKKMVYVLFLWGSASPVRLILFVSCEVDKIAVIVNMVFFNFHFDLHTWHLGSKR